MIFARFLLRDRAVEASGSARRVEGPPARAVAPPWIATCRPGVHAHPISHIVVWPSELGAGLAAARDANGFLALSTVFQIIGVLPATVFDRCMSPQQRLAHRLRGRGWPRVLQVDEDGLESALEGIHQPIRVFWSTTAATAQRVDALLAGWAWPALHVSTLPGQRRVPVAEVDGALIGEHVERTLDALDALPAWKAFVAMARQRLAQAGRDWPPERLGAAAIHDLALPNTLALMGFGGPGQRPSARSRQAGPIPAGPDRGGVERVWQSADAVHAERGRLLAPAGSVAPDSRYVLAVPRPQASPGRGASRKRSRKQDRPAAVHAGAPTRVIVPLSRAGARAARDPAQARPSTGTKAPGHDGGAQAAVLAAAACALSTATLQPVLHLDGRLNRIRGDLRNLAECARGDAAPDRDRKEARWMKALGKRMRDAVAPALLDRIDAPETQARIEGMKLLTDLPLEWLPSGGLPLALRFDVSRLPVAPVALSWQTCRQPPRALHVTAFDDVLVVRARAGDAPQRGDFAAALAAARRRHPAGRVRYRFADVATIEDFAAALHGFPGAIMVFDGQIAPDPSSGIGRWVIGGCAVSAQYLRRQCHAPPIVLLAGTQTTCLDPDAAACVPAAALALGAQAVLATQVPVSSLALAVFLARLLTRLESFLPQAVEQGLAAHWRDVVSTLLRRAHIDESLQRLQGGLGLGLSREQIESVARSATGPVETRVPDWHALFVGKLAAAAARSPEEIRRGIQEHAALTLALKIAHWGNPERLHLVRSHLDANGREVIPTLRP